jgi:hypothetical protein
MKKTKKGNVVRVDLSNVESRGPLVPEGDYTVRVSEIELKTSEKGSQYIQFVLEIVSKASKGSKLYHIASLQPQALFNLKNTLIALGVTVPTKAMDLDLDELIGLEMGVTVEHETYDGKKKARVMEVFPIDDGNTPDVEEEEDEEEDEDVEEEEDEDETMDYESMTDDELKAECKKRGLKSKKKDTKKRLIKRLEKSDAAGNEEEDEDEEDI